MAEATPVVEMVGEPADIARTGILGRDAYGGLSNGQADPSTTSTYDSAESTLHGPPPAKKETRLARLAAADVDDTSQEVLQY